MANMNHYETSFFIEGKIKAAVPAKSVALRIGPETDSAFPSGITLFFPDGERGKYERIAAAINAIMSEPDDATDAASAPLVETFAAE